MLIEDKLLNGGEKLLIKSPNPDANDMTTARKVVSMSYDLVK